ncbi:hypothetical protein TRIUR3_08300 [Triticum urartu]|uniref:Uncharacterized protein n=1 Tax=Triticum urartu TaxID=4572 RepID=M8ACD1_TRIUA|nr:hypothetical protein TRIUR3_08300 [Triticum urartu]
MTRELPELANDAAQPLAPAPLPWRPLWCSVNTSWRTGRDAQIAMNRATVNRFMAKGTPAYRFCITVLEETKWCNRSSLTTQLETRLPLHGVQILGGTNIRNDGSKTGSSFIRPASPTNRSMAYRFFTEPKIATTLYKTGPSFERRTHMADSSSAYRSMASLVHRSLFCVVPAQGDAASAIPLTTAP